MAMTVKSPIKALTRVGGASEELRSLMAVSTALPSKQGTMCYTLTNGLTYMGDGKKSVRKRVVFLACEGFDCVLRALDRNGFCEICLARIRVTLDYSDLSINKKNCCVCH